MPPNSSQSGNFPIQPQTPAVEELLNRARSVLDRLADPIDRLTGKGAENKLKESIGEYGARRYVEGKYGPNIKTEIDIPLRNNSVPILDRAYELNSSRIVVVEAKYDKSTLGKTGREIFETSEAGVERVVFKPKVVEQFSPEWFQNRIAEIRKTNGRLANRLERAWMAGDIEAVVIYVDPDGNVRRVDDRTERFTEFKQEGSPARVAGKKKSAQVASRPKRTSPDKARPPAETAGELRPVRENSSLQPAREDPTIAVEELTSAEAKPNIEPMQERVGTKRLLIEEEQPVALESTLRVGGARVSNYRIMLRIGINILVDLWMGVVIGVLFDLIVGDQNENNFRRLMKKIEPQIKKQMTALLKSPENVKRFEAAPFDQFWFEVQFHQTWSIYRSGVANQEHSRELEDIQLKLVNIVKWPGKGSCKKIGEEQGFILPDREFQECVAYQPIFKELTQGERMAAYGAHLQKEPQSHGVTRKQWLRIAHDYIVFAKKFPELKQLYKEAWDIFKFELCAAGYEDLFTPQQIENCKDENLLYRRPDEKNKTDDWRLRPTNDFERSTLDRYINRKL